MMNIGSATLMLLVNHVDIAKAPKQIGGSRVRLKKSRIPPG